MTYLHIFLKYRLKREQFYKYSETQPKDLLTLIFCSATIAHSSKHGDTLFKNEKFKMKTMMDVNKDQLKKKE